ncbi:RteC domain-containing protein [Puia dinghuensis]|uniref:Tetracycline resistance element mobilization regulatory protein rteC n=1 Tax=Puia dinghuensis TaxID=1792502 RepID=A0A8J2XRH9_9BACT|nr:RteC domain-containing protein [Puia dinghuensis]GGB01517.1 tetracycline resistance element mobilization regulatory protein rteC [Puia dinghuensis]
MERNFGRLQEELGKALQETLKESNPINRYIGSIKVTSEAILRMKEQVAACPFEGKAAEIYHFKYEAPEFYSRLFYFMELNRIEAGRVHKEPAAFIALLGQERRRLEEYFRQHDHICRYYNQGSTFQDEYLFLRQPTGQWSGDEIGTFIHTDFTIGTYWVSWIKANDRLRVWIREEMEQMEPEAAGARKMRKLKWTGGRAALIEMLSAMHAAGCFNNGKHTLKQVMEAGEEIFEVKLGQYHVALNEMSTRKDRAQFLNSLVRVLLGKFDSLLE